MKQGSIKKVIKKGPNHEEMKQSSVKEEIKKGPNHEEMKNDDDDDANAADADDDDYEVVEITHHYRPRTLATQV